MAQKPFAVVPLPLGVSAAGNQRAGNPATNLGEFKHIGLTWRTNGNGTIWAAGDFGSNQTVEFVGLLAANAQPGTTINFAMGDIPILNPSSDAYAASGNQPFISPAISRDDGLYSCHLDIGFRPGRYWRIDIAGHTGDFEASTLVVGRKLTFANFYSPGFGFGAEDLGDVELTRWGVPDEEDGLIFRRLDCTFGWMSRADMDDKFRPLVERLGKRGVALFCFDPEPTTYRQARTYFGWLRQPPFFRGAVNKFDRFEAEFSVLSMI